MRDMDWSNAKRKLVRGNWKLRLYYYLDIPHQAGRLWRKIK